MAGAPERIGPYRVTGRLGAGGMGEVYRARDERLGRWVAVKLIRPEVAGNDRARERFRREARAAAALNHPAIVQIHDLLEAPEGDALVLELVEGEPLENLLAAGPLEIALALRLGREIAEGLAEAHGQGIVHRDLKPANVMVTRSRHAKILDFGVAKSFYDSQAEANLSLDGAVVGTYRAMSPEQAKGQPVDHRSDLFSLGSLLYEMLTGHHPFQAQTPLDWMTRICGFRPPAVATLRPEVPASVSDLVGRLLAKQPAERPASALEVADVLAAESATRTGTGSLAAGRPLEDHRTMASATEAFAALRARAEATEVPALRRRSRIVALAAVLAVVAVAAVLLLRARPLPPIYVAVPRPEVQAASPDRGTELAAANLRRSLLRGLLSFDGVQPLAPAQVDPLTGPPVEQARAVAADEILTGSLACSGALCQVVLARMRGADGALLWTESFEAPVDKPYLLAEAVASHLRRAYADRRLRRGAPRLEVEPADYAQYLTLLPELRAEGAGRLASDEVVATLEAIRRRSPRFLEATIFEADELTYRFNERRDRADLERALELLEEARAAAPEDPRVLITQYEVALKAEDLPRARQALAELERLQPGDPEVLAGRAQLLLREGQGAEALELMRTVAREHPSWRYLLRAAALEKQLGDPVAARQRLEEVLAKVPGQYEALSTLAELELLSGSPERAAELYEKLVARSAEATELANLGLAYFLLERYGDAERTFRRVAEGEPRNPMMALNLADVVLLAHGEPAARSLYESVLRLVAADPASSHWQLESTRAQALAHLGRNQDAIAAVQAVLRSAADNPQAAYEVSVVFALLGDRASALYHAERALASGVEARWFEFPWFDELRKTPELASLLSSPSARPAKGAA